MFVDLVIQKSLENNFRERLCKLVCKKKGLGNKYLSQFSLCTIKFLYISQCIIHHQNKYLLILRGFTELHVETIKFHIIKNN